MKINFLINIDVDDLKKGVAFYTQALGLRVGRQIDETTVELVGASSDIYLLENKAGTTAAATTTQLRIYERHWTPVHFDIAVDDIRVAVRRAKAAGAKIEGEIQTYVYGHLALMSDPFGHGFCLIQFIGRGYDEIVL